MKAFNHSAEKTTEAFLVTEERVAEIKAIIPPLTTISEVAEFIQNSELTEREKMYFYFLLGCNTK